MCTVKRRKPRVIAERKIAKNLTAIEKNDNRESNYKTKTKKKNKINRNVGLHQ